MCCVRPARRFDARRVLAERDLPSRIAPDGGPPCAFALLQRSIATPPHRPAGPKADPSDDASSPGLSCRTTRAESGDPRDRGAFRPRGVSRPGFGYPHRDVHPRPCRRLAAPERPSASPFKAFSSRRSDHLSAAPTLVALLASIRLAPRGACGRGRLQGLDPDANSCWPPRPEGRGASMPSWGSPSRALSPSGLGTRFESRGLPPHALDGVTSGPTCVSGSCGTKGSVRPSRGHRLSWDFVTLRPSRERPDRRAGRAHVFASRLARVAGGANRSEPRRKRPGRRRSADPSPAVHR